MFASCSFFVIRYCHDLKAFALSGRVELTGGNDRKKLNDLNDRDLNDRKSLMTLNDTDLNDTPLS